MDKIRSIIYQKPSLYVIVSTIYVVLLVILKWNIHPEIATLYFGIGGILGIYILDITEAFLKLYPSPFTSIVFCGAFIILSVFIVTSSGSPLAIGIVLTLYITLLLRQITEYKTQANLNNWYTMVAGPISVRNQKIVFAIFLLLFLVESIIFLR